MEFLWSFYGVPIVWLLYATSQLYAPMNCVAAHVPHSENNGLPVWGKQNSFIFPWEIMPSEKNKEWPHCSPSMLENIRLPDPQISNKKGWMDERCFRPLLCTVKAELGRGQPGLMRWIWDETLPQSSIDRSTFYSAAHRATKWASGRPNKKGIYGINFSLI